MKTEPAYVCETRVAAFLHERLVELGLELPWFHGTRWLAQIRVTGPMTVIDAQGVREVADHEVVRTIGPYETRDEAVEDVEATAHAIMQAIEGVFGVEFVNLTPVGHA